MKVYPCRCPERHFLQTEPDVERDVTKAEADRLTATLAFTLRPDGLHAAPTKPGPAPAAPTVK